MVSEPLDKRQADPDVQQDEGWWASVLADEVNLPETIKESQKPAAGLINSKIEWVQIQSIFEKDELVCLHVHGYNRGGLLVQGAGIQGFVPVSHLVDLPGNLSDSDRHRALSEYVGKTIQLKVIECEPSQERIVFSERAAQAGEGRRKELFQSLKSGEVVEGTVTNLTEFGVFVDLGGVEGLIHVSELSWGRVQHPTEILQVGQVVRTMIINVNVETMRVALSLKRLMPNPWDILDHRYKPGDVVSARITSIMRFGAFALLEEGVEGLIHISSLVMPEGVNSLDKVLHIGQTVNVRILHIDSERRRLGLGLVAVE